MSARPPCSTRTSRPCIGLQRLGRTWLLEERREGRRLGEMRTADDDGEAASASRTCAEAVAGRAGRTVCSKARRWTRAAPSPAASSSPSGAGSSSCFDHDLCCSCTCCSSKPGDLVNRSGPQLLASSPRERALPTSAPSLGPRSRAAVASPHAASGWRSSGCGRALSNSASSP